MPMSSGVAIPAIYRRAFDHWLNEGAYQAFKNLDVADADFQKLGLGKGAEAEYEGGTIRIVRARGALVAGGLCKLYIGGANRTGTLTANTTKAVTEGAETYVKGDLSGGNVFIKSGTGVGQLRKILSNDAAAGASHLTVARPDTGLNQTAIQSPDAFATLPDATSTYSIVMGWEVVASAGVNDYVNAIALGTVTSGNWTLVQTRGYCLINCVGSTDALTAGGPIVPSATAGTGKGFTTAGELAKESRLAFAQALDAYSGAADLRHAYLYGHFRN